MLKVLLFEVCALIRVASAPGLRQQLSICGQQVWIPVSVVVAARQIVTRSGDRCEAALRSLREGAQHRDGTHRMATHSCGWIHQPYLAVGLVHYGAVK